MNITHTLESLSIQTRDDTLFCELRDLISKNFANTLANKSKIISFYEESEIPQRKYFLKFIKKLYEKQNGEAPDLKFAEYKTIKLGYVQQNPLSSMLFIDVDFLADEVIFHFGRCESLFVSYILQSFRENQSHYNQKTNSLYIKIKDESDFDALEMLFAKKEHLKFIVEFSFEPPKFERFKRNFKVQNSSKFITRFSALANLLLENFQVLNCDKDSSFETVRQSYLALAKAYHPDRHSGKSSAIQEQYRQKFERIQAAYEGLKPYFRAQNAFVSA